MEEMTRSVEISGARKQFVLYITIAVLATVIVMFALGFVFFGAAPRGGERTNTAITANQPVQSVAPASAQNAEQSAPTVEISDVSGNDPTIVDVVKKVAKHIFLPKGKVMVGTVVDPEESRRLNPVFYAHTKHGDKVLIYDDRAILYDPDIDRVLEMWYFVRSINNKI